MHHPQRLLTPLAIIILLAGCSPSDERLIEIATQSAQEQAQQNQRMAQLQQEVTSGTKQLIEADADSRRELIAQQAKLQTAAAEIADGRDELELERKELAPLRHRDHLISAALVQVGTLLACLLALVLCAYLLCDLSSEPVDETVLEFLVTQIVPRESFPHLDGIDRQRLNAPVLGELPRLNS